MWRAYLRPATESFGGFRARGRRVAVVGVPMDFTSSYRSGSRFAPSRVREISQSIELCSIDGDCVVEDEGVDDLGDLLPIPGEVVKSLELMELMAEDLAKSGKRLIAIGGDHTVTQALFSGVKRGLGSESLCLLVIDAHLDLRDELGGRYSHATCIRRLIERASPAKIAWFGTRAFSREELEYLRELKIPYTLIKSLDVLSAPKVAIERVCDFLSECQHLYISIDVDGFDPAFAPGVQTPEPVGIHPVHFIELLKNVGSEIVAVDIVEIAPPFDAGSSTVALGARLVVEVATRMYRDLRSRR